MLVTRSVTLRPNPAFYYKNITNSVLISISNIVDANNDTHADAGWTGIGYMRINNIDSIPKSALLKSVTIRIYGNRMDSSSNVGYGFNLVASQNIDNNTTGKTIIFATNLVPALVPYYRSGDTTGIKATVSATKNLTEQESRTFLDSPYPSLLFYNKGGGIDYYEFYIDFVYEAEETLIYNGGEMSSAVYVGGSKASSVYMGTKEIL